MHYSMGQFWLILLCAAGVTTACTPLTIRLARATGAMDVPRDDRRMHHRVIPRIGGLAIFIGVSLAFYLAVRLGYCDPGRHDIPRERLYGLLFSSALMYLLGMIDDYLDLPAWVKLLGQIGVATVAFCFGVQLTFIASFFGRTTFTGVVCYLLTILWIVGVTNTINLVDGLDGLAAGIVAIASFCIAYVAYIFGYYAICFPLLAVAGGCLGFLPWNFSPAKTFMGDGGSLYLGFMIASLSLLQPVKSTTVVAVIMPSLVLSLPILDTFFAIVRRLVNHKPIMQADNGHLHHRLMRAGLGQRRTVLCMYGVCGIMSMAAIMVARGLYKETVGLAIIAILYLYVLLTDPNRGKVHAGSEGDAARRGRRQSARSGNAERSEGKARRGEADRRQ
ncbi:MAG: glycosyltransferase family 4 protein [Anaerovoracaceae bacterium]|jgi:UDP-GlcNAc:undecaprenyl-phosphate GlcNAc-1-phosphate transferase